MKSFDSWFKKKFRDLHDAILCGDLIAGNYKKVSKKSYEAGQQSKQGEVDKLQTEVDELQKRIDDALKNISFEQWSDEYGDFQTPTHNLIKILKGE